MNNINLKQMDALEFVHSLEGGWDTILYDPPYLKESYNFIGSKKGKWENKMKYQHRLKIDENYLSLLSSKILEKINLSFTQIVFFNKRDEKADYIINWYKGKDYGGMGNYVLRNTEYINIYFNDKKPIQWNGQLYETEEHKPGKLPLEKPFKLIEKLLLFTQAKYVLDPFGGSFVTAKVCKKLGLKIDSCDKYLTPPDILGLDKWI